MSSFTPGPWRYQEISDAYTHIVRGADNEFIVQLSQDTSGRSEANARLIAAAPDLLAALIGLLPQTFTGNPSRAEEVAHWERERDLGNGNAPFVLAAFAAIAAATGTPD